MRSRRSLGVVLYRENRPLPVPHAFDGGVIEVKVRDLERRGSGNAARVAAHRESMVLRRDKYLSGSKIAHRMVAPSMTVREFHRVAAQRQTEQLVAEANAEDR